ncbi:MAG: T9SS type A sorting domain-containing protein, partial [Duncaniella sp.]|nr:T9SS type A sorting domain-containing protein [Duncaniella sp.]
STRWDSASRQVNGDWFNVNFNKTISVNTVILDASLSSGDGPAAYTVRAYVNGAWRDVASGENPGGFCIVTFDPVSASQIRVVQTGSKSNYWSIHEFYAGRLDFTDIDEIAADINDFDIRYDGTSVIADTHDAQIEIYGMNGALVNSTVSADGLADVTSLTPGVYIAVAHSQSGKAILKFRR